jgi:hypothetical protein
MTAAVITAHLRKGFFNTDGGYEYDLVLVAALFAPAGIGAGELSLDYGLDLDLAGTGWALGAEYVVATESRPPGAIRIEPRWKDIRCTRRTRCGNPSRTNWAAYAPTSRPR